MATESSRVCGVWGAPYEVASPPEEEYLSQLPSQPCSQPASQVWVKVPHSWPPETWHSAPGHQNVSLVGHSGWNQQLGHQSQGHRPQAQNQTSQVHGHQDHYALGQQTQDHDSQDHQTPNKYTQGHQEVQDCFIQNHQELQHLYTQNHQEVQNHFTQSHQEIQNHYTQHHQKPGQYPPGHQDIQDQQVQSNEPIQAQQSHHGFQVHQAPGSHTAQGHQVEGHHAPTQQAPASSLNSGSGEALQQGIATGGLLRPVSEIPSKYQPLFSHFPFFNIVQSTVFQDVFGSDQSLVVSAPTGSGKTVVMELALVRLMMTHDNEQSEPDQEPSQPPRVVYMAPMKALVTERYLDWRKRLAPLGLSCAEVTGDTEHDDITVIRNSEVILTTPEKWDFLTRRWRDHASLMQAVSLFFIDEVHVLNDEGRGPTLEAVVSRMKTIRATRPSKDPSSASHSLRFVAVSATIPNVEDVAAWLSDRPVSPAKSYKLEESLRPVKLRRVVLGYNCREEWTEFRFDLALNYRLPSVIATYSDNKPTLVFVSTRKAAQSCATTLSKESRLVRDGPHKQLLTTVANGLRDNKLRECVMCGVGFHHAGLATEDRRQVEELFTAAQLPVLVATSTLAMGVNLPAHLVVIKSTSHYVGGAYEEYSSAQLLQMTGRAGRPQYDTHATAVIMTKREHKVKYENLVTGRTQLESHLHLHLAEHLNAEIVLGTVTDLGVAVEWLRSTFFYVRVQHNPRHYGLPPNLQQGQLEAKLQELCTKEVNALAGAGVILLSEVDIKPTLHGRLMARYCVSFSTMKTFLQLTGTESLHDLVERVAACQEFYDIKVRVAEKSVLNEMNKTQTSSIRFPIKGKIKTREHKISCLVQATLGCDNIVDPGLSQEVGKIFRTGQRVSKCLAEYGASRRHYELCLNTLLLAKCFSCRLWENSRFVTRQLERIGPALSTAFVQAKITSFAALEAASPRDIELILNRQPPFGNRIRDQALKLPRYEVTVEQLNQVSREKSDLRVTVRLANLKDVKEHATTPPHHACILLLGDADNKVVHHHRITDAALKVCGIVSRVVNVSRAQAGDDMAVNFISETWGGLDVQSTYTPRYLPRPPSALKPTPITSTPSTPHTTSTPTSTTTTNIKNIQGVWSGGDRRACLHTCGDKSTCAHNCCKVGVSARTGSGRGVGLVPTVVEEVRKRTTQIPPTPVKRIKGNERGSGGGALDISQFQYTPSRSLLMTPKTPQGRTQRVFPNEQKICHFNGEHITSQSTLAHTQQPCGEHLGIQDLITDDVLQEFENNDVELRGEEFWDASTDMEAFLEDFEKENIPPEDYEDAFSEPLGIEDPQSIGTGKNTTHPTWGLGQQRLIPPALPTTPATSPHQLGVVRAAWGKGMVTPSQPQASQTHRSQGPPGIYYSQVRRPPEHASQNQRPQMYAAQGQRLPMHVGQGQRLSMHTTQGQRLPVHVGQVQRPPIRASRGQRPSVKVSEGQRLPLRTTQGQRLVRPPAKETNQTTLTRWLQSYHKPAQSPHGPDTQTPGPSVTQQMQQTQASQSQQSLRPSQVTTVIQNQLIRPSLVAVSQDQQPFRPSLVSASQNQQSFRPLLVTASHVQQSFRHSGAAANQNEQPFRTSGATTSQNEQPFRPLFVTASQLHQPLRPSGATASQNQQNQQPLRPIFSTANQVQRPSRPPGLQNTQAERPLRPSGIPESQRPPCLPVQTIQTSRPLHPQVTGQFQEATQVKQMFGSGQSMESQVAAIPQTQRSEPASQSQRPPSPQIQGLQETNRQTAAPTRQRLQTNYQHLRSGYAQDMQTQDASGWQDTQKDHHSERAGQWVKGGTESAQNNNLQSSQSGSSVSHAASASFSSVPPLGSAGIGITGYRSQEQHPVSVSVWCSQQTEAPQNLSYVPRESSVVRHFNQPAQIIKEEAPLVSHTSAAAHSSLTAPHSILTSSHTNTDSSHTSPVSEHLSHATPVRPLTNYPSSIMFQQPLHASQGRGDHQSTAPRSRPVAGVRPVVSDSASHSKKTDPFPHLTKEWEEVQRRRCRGKLSNIYLPSPSPRPWDIDRPPSTPTLPRTPERRDDDWRDLEMFEWCRQQEKLTLDSLYQLDRTPQLKRSELVSMSRHATEQLSPSPMRPPHKASPTALMLPHPASSSTPGTMRLPHYAFPSTPTHPHTSNLQITHDSGCQGPLVGVGLRGVGGGQQNININLSGMGDGGASSMQSVEEPQVRGILKKPTQSV